MIDLRRLRNAPDEVRANLERRNDASASQLDTVIDLDERIRTTNTATDEARADVKRLSKEAGEAKRNGDGALFADLSKQSSTAGERETSLRDGLGDLEDRLNGLLLVIPNEISPNVPEGKSDDDNVEISDDLRDNQGQPVIQLTAEPTWQSHQRVPHWDIGSELGILDSERAVGMSGSMFNMFRGAGATLSRALCQYALDRNADVWEEVRPPSLVKTETMIGTGHLPKFEDDAYPIERDELWTIPTAEVPLTSMARNSVVSETDLPWRMMAHTPCYRREAGSAGKDTRGLLRVHEFDKVELMAYATPEQAEDVMFDILRRSQSAFRDLGLHTRVLEICSGALGRSHHRSFDVEAYAPGCDQWLEVSSCSWFTDYQARRSAVRFKPAAGGANQVVHTCNGTALAVPRAFAAVVETYRQADGSVKVPEKLVPYMRGIEVITGR